MSLEEMLDVWKEVRAGLIAELAQIPAEQFGFQATPESRNVAGVIHVSSVKRRSLEFRECASQPKAH
jgi:hypothetical protein